MKDWPLGKESGSQGRGGLAAAQDTGHVWVLQAEVAPWMDVQ